VMTTCILALPPSGSTRMSSHLVSRALRAIVPLALAIGCMPRAARAQDALDAKSAVHVRDVYLADLDTLHAKVLALAIAIPEGKYMWRPAAARCGRPVDFRGADACRPRVLLFRADIGRRVSAGRLRESPRGGVAPRGDHDEEPGA
jgi:hypothetical protein